VAEKSLTEPLTTLLNSLGVRGYTHFDVAGFGERGVRPGTTPETGNVLFEVLTSEHDAERIMQRVQAAFLPQHALIVYALEARALQREKFL
jgi:hypothetical protein